jgi:hypothetical protein
MGRKIRVFCTLCEKEGKDLGVIVLPGNREHHLVAKHPDIEDPKNIEEYFEPAEVAYYVRHYEDDWDRRSSEGDWKPRHPEDALEKSIYVICKECEKDGKDVIVFPGNKKKHLRKHHKIKDLRQYNKYFELAEVAYYRRHPEDEDDPEES